MPIGATIGGGLLTAGISAIGANEARDEVRDSNRDAAKRLETVKGMAQPYVESGNRALALLDDPEAMRAAFQTDPGYQFQMDEGIKQVGQNKALSGLLHSGAHAKDILRYSQGIADQSYGNFYNREAAKVDRGQRGVDQVAGIATNQARIDQNTGENSANAMLAAATGIGKGVSTALGGFG